MAAREAHVLVASHGGLGTITMNRPERRNALSEAHMRELIDAFRRLGDDPDVGAIILAGNGPAFCAGHDFADMVERDLAGLRRLLEVCRELVHTLQAVPQPVVARVHALATADLDLDAAYDRAIAAMTGSAFTEDGREAMRSFLEKRPAVYPPRR